MNIMGKGGATLEKTGNRTARYQILAEAGGNRYRFFCELSGVMVCTTKPVHAGTPEDELRIAWETEGKKMFNQCHRCGRWVSNVMYNADALECVDCTPWEDPPRYCSKCGAYVPVSDIFCRKCGARLCYEGRASGEL